MKLTKNQLKQLIKEEMQHILKEQVPPVGGDAAAAKKTRTGGGDWTDWTWLEGRLNRIDRQLAILIAASKLAVAPPGPSPTAPPSNLPPAHRIKP